MSGRKNLSLAQRAKIAEIRNRYKGTGMSKSKDEIIDIAKMSFPKIFPKNMKDGGEVPSKLKGFSKLPEPVQQKMNPSLAKKYEQGGEVKRHSRGGKAAIAGTKFIGVR